MAAVDLECCGSMGRSQSERNADVVFQATSSSDFSCVPREQHPKLEDATCEIRLLLLPDHAKSRDFILSAYNINDLPDYCALSYCWGTEEASEEITINGIVFRVTPCLRHGLDQLCIAATPKLVWIDAICINQDDLFERNHQVMIMARIYS
jgi:hypothetical protein